MFLFRFLHGSHASVQRVRIIPCIPRKSKCEVHYSTLFDTISAECANVIPGEPGFGPSLGLFSIALPFRYIRTHVRYPLTFCAFFQENMNNFYPKSNLFAAHMYFTKRQAARTAGFPSFTAQEKSEPQKRGPLL